MKIFGRKPLSLDYMEARLNNLGLAAEKKNESIRVELGYGYGISLSYQDQRLYASVMMPAGWGSMESFNQALRQASDYYRIDGRLCPDGDEMDVQFSTGSKCASCAQFENVFAMLIKKLLDSVRKYIEFREELQNNKK